MGTGMLSAIAVRELHPQEFHLYFTRWLDGTISTGS
jgi:hypothetical protein